jgi:hypothetical protein
MLVRSDGARFPLWSLSLARHGLRYEASRVPHEHYWSDTGGRWRHGENPQEGDLSTGRHEMLVHPYWWRRDPMVAFVLSTARSGSVWLSRLIDEASSAQGLHEWTLNHRRDGDAYIQDKRTTRDYATLVERPQLARAALRAASAHHRTRGRDVIEANVYLEPFIEDLKEHCPDAKLIHLHRDGRKVVRSILQRGWYSHPVDRAHPRLPIDEWDMLSQFERACWYWRHTNERLLEATDLRWRFESLIGDLDAVKAALGELGVVVHDDLSRTVHAQPANATPEFTVPDYAEWPLRYRATFTRICGPIQEALGYPVDHTAVHKERRLLNDEQVVHEAPAELVARLHPPDRDEPVSPDGWTAGLDSVRVQAVVGDVSHTDGVAEVRPDPAEARAMLKVIPDEPGAPHGWPVDGCDYVSGTLIVDGARSLSGRLVAVYRNGRGKQKAAVTLGEVRPGRGLPFTFVPDAKATSWSLLIETHDAEPCAIRSLRFHAGPVAPAPETGPWTLSHAIPSPTHASAALDERGLAVQTSTEPQKSAHVVLARGPGAWAKLDPVAGYPRGTATFAMGSVELDPASTMGGRLFALIYGADGKQLGREVVALLRPEEGGAVFAFDLPPEVSHYALAVHVGDQPACSDLRVTDLRHIALKHDEHYRATFDA